MFVFARLPSYYVANLGRPSMARSMLRSNSIPFQTNSLFRHARRGVAYHLGYHRQNRMLTRRYILDIFDPLEPFELAWEFYCKRYEILDELLVKLAGFSKRHSVKAAAFVCGTLLVGEVLARVGILGERGKGLFHYLQKSERFNDGSQERVFQKASTFLIDSGTAALGQFRHFGGKSKFAIAVGAGAIFGRTVISTTVFCVRFLLISFFVLETCSFLGIIGEMGESILDWVEDERERHASWTTFMAKWHKSARSKLSFEWLEELYEAAVDEEKIASFGFSVGTVFSLLT